MENRDHKYFTRSKIHGQKVHYIQCEKCDNLVPVHIDKYQQTMPRKVRFEPLSMSGSAVKETLPKRVHKVNSSKSKEETMVLKINEYDSDSSYQVNDNNDNSVNYKKSVGKTDNSLVGMIVKLANKRLKEKLGEGSDGEEGEEDYEVEPFENLHNDIHYTVEEREYVRKLDKTAQEEIFKKENHIMNILKSDIPIRFKILNSDLKDRAKANVLQKVDHFFTLDPSDNEYQKLLPWVEQLDKIPFGKYCEDVINKTQPIQEIQNYLSNTKKQMDTAVFGHDTAKTQILSIIAREISNPNSGGNSIAIQGPMGNGKTTLIKEGVCKAMNRPFGFIPLGGMQDSSYLIGHEVTYEGSKCGRIVEILTETNCMNPVIFFDELDKVSDTPKGEEIMNLLCHLTDSSQNKEFNDKYFSGVPFDLSRATFIFSYNDESKINPILLDRMTRIKTNGFDKKQKTNIVQDYVLPKVLSEFGMVSGDVTFEEEAIHRLIEDHSDKEKGVRNLKRNVETIVAKLNIMRFLLPDQVTQKDETLTTDENTVVDVITDMVNNVVKHTETGENTEAMQNTEAGENTEAVENNKAGENTEAVAKDTTESDETKQKEDIKKIVNFTIDNFKLPYKVRAEDINFFLSKKSENASYAHMYM